MRSLSEIDDGLSYRDSKLYSAVEELPRGRRPVTLMQKDIARELLMFGRGLRDLNRSIRRLAPMLSVAASMNGAPRANGRSRPRLSAKARASMVLQGRYMGYMRQLKPRQKAQVKRIREMKGVRAAIVKAKALAIGQ